MIRYSIPAFAALGLATTAQAAEIQIAVTGPVVELSVIEQVEAEPDLVNVSAGVTTDASTAVEALRLNSVEMRKVIDRLKALGVAERDIQTTGINLNARYDYDQRQQRQIFRGYQASNRVSVTLRDIDETGKVLDALVAAGATDLSGPSFSLDDDTSAKAQARGSAMTRGRAQALEYARMAGYADIRLLEVNETISGFAPPQPMMRQESVQTAADTSAPVQPGLVATSVNITVKYEMTR
ncbi:SIMPL domain-containing protein [Qipengyuania psychrotolerans]|uniref:SIMPL domain-containing protein n=1 Tax=Qipengyuania psychrotolerans TaxID=2867238 RepID=A0ABX8ZB71_9SPHN|nr:SIMPL domain-containing protein [Qipengyuania psychrotolerans]QZD86245.1 SIMPL domain-containing protein [Qipengyuania psychrotolerans]